MPAQLAHILVIRGTCAMRASSRRHAWRLYRISGCGAICQVDACIFDIGEQRSKVEDVTNTRHRHTPHRPQRPCAHCLSSRTSALSANDKMRRVPSPEPLTTSSVNAFPVPLAVPMVFPQKRLIALFNAFDLGLFSMVRLYSMMSLMRPQNLIDLLDIWSPMNPNQIIRREIIIACALASV
jgi:hypothetical protein